MTFELLLDSSADEIDQLLFKNNLIFNGLPAVPHANLFGSLIQQFNRIGSEVIKNSCIPFFITISLKF